MSPVTLPSWTFTGLLRNISLQARPLLIRHNFKLRGSLNVPVIPCGASPICRAGYGALVIRIGYLARRYCDTPSTRGGRYAVPVRLTTTLGRMLLS